MTCHIVLLPYIILNIYEACFMSLPLKPKLGNLAIHPCFINKSLMKPRNDETE